MMYVLGNSHAGLPLELAVPHNIVVKCGSWFWLDGQRLGQGRENAKKFLDGSQGFYARTEEGVRMALGVEDAGVGVAVNPEGAAVAASGNGKKG